MTEPITPKRKVLVIDDEELILSISNEILKFLGYECLTAEDGEAALRLMRDNNPDLILCDFYLPEMPGEKILEMLKKDNPDCKVLIASGRELNDDEQERLYAKGVLGFINKPFTINDLSNILKAHI